MNFWIINSLLICVITLGCSVKPSGNEVTKLGSGATPTPAPTASPKPTASPSPTPVVKPKSVWLTPNPLRNDNTVFFTQPQTWAQSRALTQVFQFYQLQIEGPQFDQLAQANAFKMLNDWNIAIGLEAGAIKDWDCTTDVSGPHILSLIQKIPAQGGKISIISMDEPFFASKQFCNQSPETAANLTSKYINFLRAEVPGIIIGDIEPYPAMREPALEDFITKTIAAGGRFDFFHLDVDRNHASQIGANVDADLKKLKKFCEDRNIPFGVIFWSAQTSSDQAFFNDAKNWINKVKGAIGWPTNVIYQSWSENGVPAHTPETSTQVFSLTRLLLETLN